MKLEVIKNVIVAMRNRRRKRFPKRKGLRTRERLKKKKDKEYYENLGYPLTISVKS